MKKHTILAIGFTVIALSGYAYWAYAPSVQQQGEHGLGKAKGFAYDFQCKDNKLITATFYPSDDIQADLILSDGRILSLPHAMSGSGARYANQDESLVFWEKGNTAFFEENGTSTFEDCVTTTTYPELQGENTATTTTDASGEKVITLADNNSTLNLKVGDRFVVKLGDLQWNLLVSDQTVITPAETFAPVPGAQGVYQASKPGTTMITGTGRPNCAPGAICPMYMVSFKLTVNVTK